MPNNKAREAIPVEAARFNRFPLIRNASAQTVGLAWRSRRMSLQEAARDLVFYSTLD